MSDDQKKLMHIIVNRFFDLLMELIENWRKLAVIGLIVLIFTGAVKSDILVKLIEKIPGL